MISGGYLTKEQSLSKQVNTLLPETAKITNSEVTINENGSRIHKFYIIGKRRKVKQK